MLAGHRASCPHHRLSTAVCQPLLWGRGCSRRRRAPSRSCRVTFTTRTPLGAEKQQDPGWGEAGDSGRGAPVLGGARVTQQVGVRAGAGRAPGTPWVPAGSPGAQPHPGHPSGWTGLGDRGHFSPSRGGAQRWGAGLSEFGLQPGPQPLVEKSRGVRPSPVG